MSVVLLATSGVLVSNSGVAGEHSSQAADNARSLQLLERPAPTEVVTIEGESGSRGYVMVRSAASGTRTLRLAAGQSMNRDFRVSGGGRFVLTIRYSNDNFGPSEVLKVKLDGRPIGSFTATDTGDYGHGWNQFATSPQLGPIDINDGSHTLTIDVVGGSNGIEIDFIQMKRTTGSSPTHQSN
ncbi:MAG: hypothetical protein HT579_04150 [Candidatus Accumulibacter similis]|nr:MAG: hypothetical protein HT579_04150 [Candidatus Accumulibacter similis]